MKLIASLVLIAAICLPGGVLKVISRNPTYGRSRCQ